jgi:hypothetical protein
MRSNIVAITTTIRAGAAPSLQVQSQKLIPMPNELDPRFFDRADAVIHLANQQLHEVERGKVSASLMYATARFNAWVSVCGFSSPEEFYKARQETIDYFVRQYTAMLEENLDDYHRQFRADLNRSGS